MLTVLFTKGVISIFCEMKCEENHHLLEHLLCDLYMNPISYLQ